MIEEKLLLFPFWKPGAGNCPLPTACHVPAPAQPSITCQVPVKPHNTALEIPAGSGTPGENIGSSAAPGHCSPCCQIRQTQRWSWQIRVCFCSFWSLTNNSLYLLNAARKCKYNSFRLFSFTAWNYSAFLCKGRHRSRNYVVSFSSV